MKIHAFVLSYPNVYKPYYDVHFADLIEKGHDLTILAQKPLEPIDNQEIRRERLRSRTVYYLPDELRGVPRFARHFASGILHPRRALCIWWAVASEGVFKNRVKGFVRGLCMPNEPPDLRLVHGHGTLRLFKWLKRLDSEVPLAFYYHGGIPEEGGGVRTPGDEVKTADIVFTNSRHSKEVLESAGVSSEKIEILPISFDLSTFHPPSPREYRCGGRLNLVSVGRLSEGKGYAYSIRAIARTLKRNPNSRFHYTIVGGGILESQLRQLAEDLDVAESVTFTGPLENREVIRILGQSDVLVFPSVTTPHCAETQGTVIQEAMLMKALPITTCTGGVCDSIPPFMKSFHVPERDEEALSQAIERMDALSVERLTDMGRKAAEWTRKRYDVRLFNDRLLEITRQKGKSIDTRAS